VTAPLTLPPFKVIDAALRTTTDTLIRAVITPTAQTPDWNEFEWRVARAVCGMQGITGLLATRLRWRGPASWHEFLAAQFEHIAVRDSRIAQLLVAVDEKMRSAGIAYVPLKGSSLRAFGIYRPGERPQSDVDMLIQPADAARIVDLLQSMGYVRLYAARRHDVFVPAAGASVSRNAEHRDNPIKIELHEKVSEYLPVDEVDITAGIRPANPQAGANNYPNPAALLRHLCLHNAGAMRANAARFIQVFDIAELARRLQPDDWRELTESARAESWWMYSPLIMAERHLPGSVPAPVLARLRSICPLWLRRRYENLPFHRVSWSNLRIEALPGCEWSRSPGEALRLLRSRLFPTREALDELALVKVFQPQLLRQRWYGASHPERIVRWLFSHPPRVQTMSALTGSLED
jgi:hypothetical protein